MNIPFEITPQSLVISPNNPLQVQLKNNSGKKQDVYVTVDSLIFRILSPTGVGKNSSQIESSLWRDQTLYFQIGLLDETTLNLPIDNGDYIYCKSLEGDLSVMYGPELYAEKNANSVYEMIDFWNHYEVQQVDPVKKYFPLALEHETKAIKKRKIEHEKYRKEHAKEIEEWNAEQERLRQYKREKEQREKREKEDKEKEKMKEDKEKMKKKRRKCILM
ncbi:Protein CBG24305 [Caenorhabditis briggsae]|uniref:Protein CBG24305 n=2 Tax=Caenorhabditis briggsae TaxID=6238 RepID=A8WKF0_CAEBR|nr:Protein CBG24305 [Caenorhabditis briggsae]ULT91977.1 hypothetical protein L3Y34_009575 [Caenorhabditis briggsae]CAP20945.1 Protein CBG24305 [Caenorhabditis briggsae]